MIKSIVQTPTPKLEESLDFYQRLSFKPIDEHHPTILTDGIALIEIKADRFARAGIRLYRDSWATEVSQLEKERAVLAIDQGYLLAGPSGMWIYLLETTLDIEFTPQEKSFGLTGNYAGISLETTDIQRSQKLWETLHFSVTMGNADQGWVSLANSDGFGVSLMAPMSCPHLFFNPSLTYFNGKINNPEVIRQIRAAGIPITEEITHFNKEGAVDNIIIRDPGGLGFFLFNDG